MSDPGGVASGSPRLVRRARPTPTALLAAAGAIVAASGPLLVGGDRIDPLDKGLSTLPGAGLAIAAAVVGYLAMTRFRAGPLATAGSTLVVVSVPGAFFFVTGGADPLSMTGILSMSSLVFLVSWAIGPARHRAVFLGAGLVTLWLFAREVLDPVSQSEAFTSSVPPTVPIPGLAFVVDGAGLDFTASGVVSLFFGAGYIVLAEWFDRRGWNGASIAPAAAGLTAVAAGLSFLAMDFELAASGFVMVGVGAVLAVYGGRRARRVTTRVGAVAVSVGLLLFVVDMVESLQAAGIALIVVGSAVVAAAWFAQKPLAEGDEVEASSQRLSTRPDPQAAVAVAAGAAALVFLGVLAVGADSLGDSRVSGTVLCALLLAAGVTALARGGQGALGSAGSVAALTAVPALVVFASLDLDSDELLSAVVVLAVSTAAWAGTWFWSKRTVFAGAAVFAGWILVLELVEEAVSFLVSSDGLFAWILFGFFRPEGRLREWPDPSVLGLLTLAVAVACLVAAGVAERRGLVGPVTALAPPTVVCSVVGILLLVDDLDQIGSGVLLAAVGSVIAVQAARGIRRASAWAGIGLVVVGTNLVITEFVDSATSVGLVSVVVGAVLVAAAHGLAGAVSEPDELQPEARSV